ncbi:MAG TPA: SDR family NAD(P)-dependent oxidoreductase [Mycobacterium sp.]|uniref:SDR family NAD(P)-dependent oxidoreductase n=1 Tax=Mycolicibacterium sp. TaxID=2320850 RepID=UPI0025FCB464|nr:SDR family NAD(P)-dependent oxidoreductase [Mycolicibacterium sp.]HPX36697.1 SDR family NAD(P)-dependent oxidoreductase [Mycobacterium sp.]HQC76423.1 SDR family NAD(P)-dependent oxidoreductase [Mycobacterium sp.]
MKVWFITGTSRGLGREWAAAALRRGDAVAAAARDTAALDGLVAEFGDAVLPLRLDVTDRTACFAAVAQAHEHFGRLDVVVNNAGTGQYGFVEELSEADIRAQLETNFLGAVWVVQAALPYLRGQGGGHILQVSSIGGVTAFPQLGAYHASKWALEGLSQSLAQEVAPFGVRVTIVEPGGFNTSWVGSAGQATRHPDYAEAHRIADLARDQRMDLNGDPGSSAAAVMAVVDDEDPPLRIFLGEAPFHLARADYERRLATWEQWQPVAASAGRVAR